MVKLTIHTATYNRAYILPKAYESLKKQTCKDFEWIITDDGSTDGTEELVQGWMNEDNGFPIRYNKLNHVGVPRALNSGIKLAASEWFLMLDSDDHLVENTVEKALSWVEEIKDDPHYAGIGFAKCFPDGRYMKDQTPLIDPEVGYVDATHLERKKYNIDMDMCEVHRTELFRKYPFQCWETETFAPEQLSWLQFALDGLKLRWHADKLYVCDYLPDGLTKNDQIVKNNPMGYAMMYNQNLLFSESFQEKCVNVLRMTALAMYAGNLKYIFTCNEKALAVLLLPAGILLGLRRKCQYAKLN